MTTEMEINREQWPNYFSEQENDGKENDESEKSEYEIVDEEEEATAIAHADLMILNLNKDGLVEGVDPDDEDTLRGVVPEVFTSVANDEVHFDESNIDPFKTPYNAMLEPMIKDNEPDKRYISPIDVCKRKFRRDFGQQQRCKDSCNCSIVKSGVIINRKWYAKDYRVMYQGQIKEMMNDIVDQVVLMNTEPIVRSNMEYDGAVQQYIDNMSFGDDELSEDGLSDDESELDEEDAEELLRCIATSPEKIVDEAVIAQMKEFEEEEKVVVSESENEEEEGETNYKAAQRIQALARGYLYRRVIKNPLSINYNSDDDSSVANPNRYYRRSTHNCWIRMLIPGGYRSAKREDLIEWGIPNEEFNVDRQIVHPWTSLHERMDGTYAFEYQLQNSTTITDRMKIDRLWFTEREARAIVENRDRHVGITNSNNDYREWRELANNYVASDADGSSLNVIASVAVETASRGRVRPKGVAGRRKTKAYERRNPNGLDFLTNCISQVPTRKRKRGKRMQNVNSEIRNMDEEITPDRLKEIFRHGFCPYEGCNYHEDRRSQRWYRKKGAEQHLIDIHNCTVLDEDGVAKNIYPFKCNHPKCQTLILAKKGMHSFGEYKEHMQRHCRKVTKVMCYDKYGALASCGKTIYPFQYNNCPLTCTCWTERLGDGCKDGCKKCIKRRRLNTSNLEWVRDLTH